MFIIKFDKSPLLNLFKYFNKETWAWFGEYNFSALYFMLEMATHNSW